MVHAVASDDTNDATEKAIVEVAELNAKVGVLRRMCASADSSSTVKIGKRSSGDAQVPVSVLVASFLAVPRNRAEAWSEGEGRADVEA